MAAETKKLAEFVNKEDGVSSFVIEGDSGKYHVIFRDDDDGMNLPHISIYSDLEIAIGKAKNLV